MQKISTFQELDESQVDNKKKMEGSPKIILQYNCSSVPKIFLAKCILIIALDRKSVCIINMLLATDAFEECLQNREVE